MSDQDWLAARFEEQRSHLRSVALRMLGSATDADDTVQEAWIRLSRSDAAGIENIAGWLTTVVSRVALDVLRSRAARQDRTDAANGNDEIDVAADPEQEAVLADSIGAAMLIVLDTLSPAERLAFVLHDMFAVPFDDIAVILDRSTDAAKMLASRGRRRVQGTEPGAETDPVRQRRVVDAFLAASRSGDFEALLTVLHPDVVLHADSAGVQMGALELISGAAAVAGVFCGRALGAQPTLIDGSVGMAWAPGGRTKVVWDVTVSDGHIVRIEMIAATERIDELDLETLADV